MKVITIVSGAILSLTGVWCVARPGATFLAMAFVVGIAMLIHGISGILNYISERPGGFASGYVLADGIIALVLSVVVLANQLATDAVIPTFFGMWLLFSGLMHVMQAVAVRDAGERNWKLVFGFGLLAAAAGVTAFIRPITGAAPPVLLLGVFFLIQGVSVIMLGLHIKNHRKKRR